MRVRGELKIGGYRFLRSVKERHKKEQSPFTPKNRAHLLHNVESMEKAIRKAIKILSFPKNMEKGEFQRTTMVKRLDQPSVPRATEIRIKKPHIGLLFKNS